MYPLPEKVSWYKNTLLEGKQRSATLKRKENSLAFKWCNLLFFLPHCVVCHPASSLRVSSPGGSGCVAGKGRRTCNYTWKTHESKCAPRVMTSLLMSFPPISISHRLFRCKYSNSRDVVARSPSFSRPTSRASPRACSQAIQQRVFVSCKGPISAVYARKKRQEN